MNIIGTKILEWHKQIDRDLPWKQTDDPYFIWLSEIILQQTRVQQGLPYYLKFIKQYPSVHDLANASQEEVFKTWEGLGYYSRARNLHKTAKYISGILNGKFPNNYDDLLKLSGIGPYTAAAISSFAFDEDRAVLDGNVFRVLSRIYDIDIDILSSKGKKAFAELANSTMIQGKSAIYNQAIMDFGALQCVPANPNCMFCPLQANCLAFANGTVLKRPVKKKSRPKRNRFFHFLITDSDENSEYEPQILIERRESKDIWQGLYQFPLLETDNHNAPSRTSWEELIGQKLNLIETSPEEYKQTLSHQYIHAYFHRASLQTTEKTLQIDDSSSLYGDNTKESTFQFATATTISNFSFPRVIREYLKDKLYN